MSDLSSPWAGIPPADLDPVKAIAVFNHPHNVQVGQGRVIFAEPCVSTGGVVHERGWVLPGGQRTTNRVIAELVASRINLAHVNGYLTTPAT